MESILILFQLIGQFAFFSAYNMDVEKPLIYFGVAGDQFGYSAEILSNNNKKLIVIGAPENHQHPETNRSGLLYSCPVEPMERKTNFSDCREIQSEMALAKRFGSTIYRHGGSIVVCSPLRGLFNDRDITAGGCEVFRNMTSQEKLNIRAKKVQEHYPEHAKGMFGFSIISENDTSVVLGGPNACGNDGGLALFKEVSGIPTGKYLYSSNCSRFLGGHYYGYSLSVMRFNGSNLYVVGSPGFSNKEGVLGLMEVVEIVYRNNKYSLEVHKKISGLQNGGGFGQSLCVIDINRDGLDDIIVGAPLEYRNLTSKSSVEIDVGNVYVYLGDNLTTIRDNGIPITGDLKVFGRFGTAIAGIGDINEDSFQDLAVGAPYENNMRGAIYIFNGCPDVKNWKYSQRIEAATINSNLRGFGFYISRSQEDIDNNEYKDFSVGAYKSGMAVVLRSRPIISIEPKIIFKQTPVPLNSSGLNCSDGNDYPCLEVEVCFNLTGKGIRSGTYINFTIWGDVTISNQRIHMEGNKSSVTISDFIVYRNISSCKTLQANVPRIGMSFFKSINEPLEFKVNLSLSGRTPEYDVLPILRKGSVVSHQNNVSFRTSCAQNEKCQPKFSGDAEINDHKDNGEFETFKMDFVLRNHGDPATTTMIEILKTEKAVYSGIVVSSKSEKVVCKENNSTMVICNVTTDPFYQHMVVQISLDFKIDPQNNDAQGFVDFYIWVRYIPSGRNAPEKSNITYVLMRQLAVVSVGGEPSQDQREMDMNSEMLIHKETFRVYNRGPSTVDGLILQINVPWSIAGVQILSEVEYNKDICNLATDAELFDEDMEDKTEFKPDSKPQVDNKQNSLLINCSHQDVKCHLLKCKIKKLTRDDLDDIKLNLNLTSYVLNLLERYPVIKYITSGKLNLSRDSDFEGNLQKTDGEIVLTIIPKKIDFVTRKIDLGVVIGGSVGGFLFLILIGIILWKVGFFKRKKRQQVDEYKRRTALMKRQSRMSKMSRVEIAKND